jgi:hypothetical protein
MRLAKARVRGKREGNAQQREWWAIVRATGDSEGNSRVRRARTTVMGDRPGRQ